MVAHVLQLDINLTDHMVAFALSTDVAGKGWQCFVGGHGRRPHQSKFTIVKQKPPATGRLHLHGILYSRPNVGTANSGDNVYYCS